MSSSISCRYLEFDRVCVDLKHVSFSADGLNDVEYIIFINVKRAMYTNFKICTDLSLETLAELLFVEAKCMVNGEAVPRAGTLGECVTHVAGDRNKSLIIKLHENARIVVARTIYFDECYHKRVSGYIDFENRHNQHYIMPDDNQRAAIDREWEIKLLEFT
jgi:Nucleopolyhedrovirus protein of unknown function (DUF918)